MHIFLQFHMNRGFSMLILKAQWLKTHLQKLLSAKQTRLLKAKNPQSSCNQDKTELVQ